MQWVELQTDRHRLTGWPSNKYTHWKFDPIVKKSGNCWTYGSKEFFKYLFVTLQTIQYDWFLLNPLLCLGILAPVIKINLTKSLIRQDLCLKCIFYEFTVGPWQLPYTCWPPFWQKNHISGSESLLQWEYEAQMANLQDKPLEYIHTNIWMP